MQLRLSPPLGLALLAALLTLAPRPAFAARVPWQGELVLELLAEGLPPLIATGTGVATVNGSAGGSHLSALRLAGGVGGTAFTPVTDPEVTVGGLVGFEIHASAGTGSFQFDPTSGGGTLPLPGTLRYCLFDPFCLPGGFLGPPLTAGAGAVGVGIGGLVAYGGGEVERFSIVGSPWTVGTALVSVPTTGGGSVGVPVAGWRHGALSFTTSTALSGGALSLVTPLRISSESGSDVPGFARLSVRFLPEPGGLLLLAPGLWGLLVFARARSAAERKLR